MDVGGALVPACMKSMVVFGHRSVPCQGPRPGQVVLCLPPHERRVQLAPGIGVATSGHERNSQKKQRNSQKKQKNNAMQKKR